MLMKSNPKISKGGGWFASGQRRRGCSLPKKAIVTPSQVMKLLMEAAIEMSSGRMRWTTTLQVFYSKTGRNNVVSSYAGRRNETSIYSGKVGNGNRNVSGTSGYGAGKIGKDGKGRIENGKGIEGIDSRKVVAEKRGVKIGVKKVRGSRFSIFSKGIVKEFGLGIS
ncbi:hypothetical protein LWI28_005612 [Acer negundo]|uniref:Uncharacterized protein n=1 Tax=Acer negundo TaxID=4023 RepID=A0AAD5NF15_ACENE|nr:hypothetical protein LWI28_005612 [Acer negundo]